MTSDSLTYDSSSGQYYVDVSLEEPDSVADAVIYGVAEIRDRDPIELPPLGNVVDTDSLTTIFHSAGDSDATVAVTFEYSGFVVTVHDNGQIRFEESD